MTPDQAKWGLNVQGPIVAPGGSTGGYLSPGAYGGYASGAQDWSNHYQGLASALANYGQGQGTVEQANLNRQGQAEYAAATGLGGDAAARQRAAGLSLGGIAHEQSLVGQKQAGGAYGSAQDSLGMLSGAAAGRVPSAAEIQQGQGVAAAMKAQLTAASSARGGAYAQAAAQQEAAAQGASLQGKAVADAAALRANEQSTARGQYAGAAGNLYGTASQSGLSYADLAARNVQAGEAGGAQSALQGQQLAQGGAATFGLAGEQAKQSYDTMGMQGQQAYEGMSQNAVEAAMGNDTTLYGINQGVAVQNAALGAQRDSALIGAAGSTAASLLPLLAASDERLKTDVSPQGGADPGTGLGAPMAGGVNAYDPGGGTRQAPPPEPSGMDKGAILKAMQGLRGASQQYAQTAGAGIGPMPPPPRVALPPQAAAPPIGRGLPQVAVPPPVDAPLTPPPMMSDARAKQDVRPAPTADALLAMLDKSKATFAYKNPADQPVSPQHPHLPGARFGGVIAQDLERTPEIGHQLVTDTPRGKMIEPQAGLSAALMAIGRLHERLNALEGGHHASK